MNNDEVLNMPAGREMDVLIAESLGLVKNVGTPLELILPFSTNLLAAWEVVEKLCDENGCDVVRVCKRDSELLRGEWSCNFGRGFEAFGETVPLAICRSALLARGLTQRVPDAGDSAQ